MLVTVWRHGEAGGAPRDRDRALTNFGAEALGKAVLRFKDVIEAEAQPAVTSIVSSPWLRTLQTADILGGAVGVTPRSVAWLAPNAALKDVELIFGLQEKHLLLVSHQPLVSELLWYWLDDKALAPLAPGGWASVLITDHGQGLGTLSNSEVHI
jgi:phosphohistidine phosphatase